MEILDMQNSIVHELPIWKKLSLEAERINQPEFHLKNLLNDSERLQKFSVEGSGLFYDFSRERIDAPIWAGLLELARTRQIQDRFSAMIRGEKINVTEGRAVLHTAARSFSTEPIMVDGMNVTAEIDRVRKEIEAFSSRVRSGEIKGSTGKRFSDVVVIGIGGSYLGPEFVSTALEAEAEGGVRLHYLANVDIHNFGRIAAVIDPEATLWVVISKSYTTAETTANELQAKSFMTEKGLDFSKHVVTVTAKGSPGDDPANPVLAAFHMFDFIGGRYSVTSAVGGVPLSLYLGYPKFERFLKGAQDMDLHTASTSAEKNLPLVSALVSVWNNNFLGYAARGIIPYASPLAKLAPHVQQLNMESNGKSVILDGQPVGVSTGPIIFGEPGTNAQHSFFQLAHQGRPFPIDFIGVLKPQYPQYRNKSKGVINHQELWANLIAQPRALALGRDHTDPARQFSGNRPSSTLVLPDLSPESIGKLLSFYEAGTVFEAFIWDINAFDQFGVELGKVMAEDIRKEMAKKNEDPGHAFSGDPISKAYLERLFR
jgi:glucose-6-phosphate isomerase